MLAGNHSPARLEQPYEISTPDGAEPDTKKKKNNKAIPKPESKNVIEGMLKKFPGHNFGELNGYFHCFHCKKPVNIGTHGIRQGFAGQNVFANEWDGEAIEGLAGDESYTKEIHRRMCGPSLGFLVLYGREG